MLVLHGLWSPEDGLCLWAEDSGRNVKSRSEAIRSARPHPFAAKAGTLAQALSWLSKAQPGEMVLRLPSLRMSPLDSPELVRARPRPAPVDKPALLPWTVPLLALTPAAALAPLARLLAPAGLSLPAAQDAPNTDGNSGPDVRLGATIGFLASLAALATDLVTRGRVLPTLARGADGPVGTWRPVLTGPDAAAAHALAIAMPPACRAAPGREDPYQIVEAALGSLADAAARATLADAASRRALAGASTLVPPRRGRAAAHLPAAEAWLASLATPDGRFESSPRDLDELASALRSWDEIGTGPAGPARATFRLTEAAPAADGEAMAGEVDVAGADIGAGGSGDLGANGAAGAEATGDGQSRWWLEFLLQSIADPSLLVPAARAWADDGSLSRWLARPQELLLAELGRASRVYPAIADGLRQARPVGLELDADDAFHFLSAAAPALDQAGFGVMLPSWWDRRRALSLTGSAATPVDGVVAGAGKFGKDQLMDFSWRLAVGDEALTDAEIAALAATKAPLIRLRGQWVAVDREQLRRGLEFLARNGLGRASAADVLRMAASHPDDLGTPLPVAGVTADGWLGDLLAGAAPQTLQLAEAPVGFGATLRPYQQRGLSWLAFLGSLGLGACLADDMGLGKTVQLLALEAADRAGGATGPTLLLCPMSLVGNWQREAARFAPELVVYAHHGGQRPRGDNLRARISESDLVLTTYATATRDIEELAGYPWRRVVLDEAQAIKNSLSQASKAARRLTADHRVALTGTPVENRLAELWSVIDFVNPGLLGTPEQFRARYSIPVERHGMTEPAQRLRAIIRPYVLRRLKTDPAIIDDLPEKIEMRQYCKLTTEQASLYQSVVDDMLERIENSEGIERRGNVLAAMAKLKQACNHPALLLHDRSAIGRRSGKVIRLEEILEEILAGGDKAICFSQYTEFLDLLLPHLSARFGTDIAYLHGGTPKDRRDELVTAFQSEGGPPIFLLSLKAGGTGLTLTAASHVIHLDRWWNPAVENQATDRAFRIGQRRNVEVHKLICTGTLEERIDEMIEEKKALADLVVADGEGWLTELSTGDLRKVFELSADAVDD